MFLVSLALTDADLSAFGVTPTGCQCCVSSPTQARSIMHRLIVEEAPLARAATDLLDLRYAHEVLYARSLDLDDLAAESRARGVAATEAPLVGWAWALLTDQREPVRAMARNLMGECYVRGMRSLA